MCLTIPARVVSVEGTTAVVESRGRERRVDASFVIPAVGDYVLMVSGVIVQRLEPEEAREAIRAWAEGGAARAAVDGGPPVRPVRASARHGGGEGRAHPRGHARRARLRSLRALGPRPPCRGRLVVPAGRPGPPAAGGEGGGRHDRLQSGLGT